MTDHVYSRAGRLLTLILLLSSLSPGCSGASHLAAPEPASPELYTAGGCVKMLTAAPDGSLWAATDGGVVHWGLRGRKPERWTTAEGMPTNDLRAVSPSGSGAYAATAGRLCRIEMPGKKIGGTAGPGGEEIRCLLALQDHTGCWVGTSGGLYLYQEGKWEKRFSGEVWRIGADGRQLWAITHRGLLRMKDLKLFGLPAGGAIPLQEQPGEPGDQDNSPKAPHPAPGKRSLTPNNPSLTPTTQRPTTSPAEEGMDPAAFAARLGTVTAFSASGDGIYLGTTVGLWQLKEGKWRAISLPRGSPASHVSALCSGTAGTFAGLYGDGVYRLSSDGWRRISSAPAVCRETTALALNEGKLIAGTSTGGAWASPLRGARPSWAPLEMPYSLPNANIYGLAAFQGALWAATFDHGLLRLENGRCLSLNTGAGPSANSPRSLVVFKGSLYVAYATGQVDRFDGTQWRQAFTHAELRRPGTYAISSDGRRLYLGGWGGWEATDGRSWEYHYDEGGLRDQVVHAIVADQSGAVWIGTEAQGLFRYLDGSYTHYYESQGLTDDWITCLAVSGHRLLVGAYTGGLLEMQGERFNVLLKPESFAIRTICFLPGSGHAAAATPLGLYLEEAGGWRLVDLGSYGGIETQALLPTPHGLWVGSRSALAFLRFRS